MNNDEMNKLFKSAGKKSGVDIDKMKQAAEKGELDEYINKNLSGDLSGKLKDVLSDKAKTEKLLSTPQAKELMKKLGIK